MPTKKHPTPAPKPAKKWLDLATSLPDDTLTLAIPLRGYVVEALAVADFLERNWSTTYAPKSKTVEKLGFESMGKSLSKGVAAEIRELVPLVTEANYEYEKIVDPKSSAASTLARGRAIVDEITATLEWHLDDGVEDARDAELAAIEAAHRDDPATADAVALQLEDFARLAAPYAKEIDGLGGFDAKILDEAHEVAKTLRAAPLVAGFTASPASRAALGLRNRYVILLQDRVERVRKAARFLYRDDKGALPANVMGGYVARRKAIAKRAATRKANAAANGATPSPTTPAVPTPDTHA